jgi:hypothetical protein
MGALLMGDIHLLSSSEMIGDIQMLVLTCRSFRFSQKLDGTTNNE